MRFITEFESTYEAFGEPNFDKYINAYKGRGELEIGAKIGEVFGWKEDNQRFKIKNTLEIEAFPMDKWLKFKAGINECIEQAKANNYPPMFALLSIGNLLKELELNPKQQKEE
jgi:hypothetical protein